MGISMEAQKEAILEKSKKTMSVPEMRRLLGLKKTDSYWLVPRNFFQTHIVNGQMRVDIASFEKWYANQVKHKKVNGEEPGAELMKSSGRCGCGPFDEGSGKSGDGGVADESGEELES